MSESIASAEIRRDRGAFFDARAKDATHLRQVLDGKCRLLSDARLVIFCAVALVPILVWRSVVSATWLWVLIPLATFFFLVAIRHDRALFQREKCDALREICEACSKRSALMFDELPPLSSAAVKATTGQTALVDLGVVGEKSLIRLVDRTATASGARHLIRFFGEATDVREALCRQQAVQELLDMREFRESLEVIGIVYASSSSSKASKSTRASFDFSPEDGWLQKASESLRPTPFFWRVSLALPPIWVILFFLWGMGLISPIFLGVFGTVQTCLALIFSRSQVATHLREFRSLPRTNPKVMEGLGELFSQVESANFHGEKLRSLQETLAASDGVRPSKSFARLSGILSVLKLLDQPLFHLPLAALFFFDVHMAQVAWRWSEDCGRRLPNWMDALGELEALSSLAGYADTQDVFSWPTLSEAPVLRATGLGHPLIPTSKRVTNEVCLGKPGQAQALVVTGSNMAGKTTFLRSIGINGLLAFAGGPVCAQALEIGAFPVVTSMRISDSLENGLSLFHAEVRQMKSLLDASACGPVIFLLDEILHGTNTTERQRASRAILHALVARGSIGAVATHDVALSTMEKESSGRIQNVHFTDTYDGNQLRFDYRMHFGPVSSSNALLVMAQEGICVENLEKEI